ncbi:hypothetical protein [Streptomyces sp. SP17KL33]|uniref:hypothetical protein n=1 Tax=Streptomyces sp. SP17KL33 TaxID=3002534 RepID=UPI002E77387E|nr:hypothetical protein [Streptomyces sp. SP17KL33]MEE1838193.1 hypothetical protein [Streptomyces sp. SP17KL33]
MSTPMHATRRTRRPDGARLTLAYSADTATDPTPAQEHASAPDTQADLSRTQLRYGSATVRALIALGTMAAALFHPELGKQLVSNQGPCTKPSGSNPEAADDDAPVDVVTPLTPATPRPRVTPTPEPQKTTAGRWTPGQPTVRVAYTIAGPAPTGRHRKAVAEKQKPGLPAVGTGRHRRTSEDHTRPMAPVRERAVPLKDRVQLSAPRHRRAKPVVSKPDAALTGLAVLAMAG